MHTHLDLEGIFSLCKQRDINLTPLRKTLLTCLYNSNVPLTAYALLDQLKPEQPKLKAMSVYRILEFLIDHDIVHRIESLNAYAVCTCPDTQHQSQWLICDSCDKAIELPSNTLTAFLDTITESSGFEIKKPTIELFGTCKQCQMS